VAAHSGGGLRHKQLDQPGVARYQRVEDLQVVDGLRAGHIADV
jgi:hypothetical protein